jgi:hypothetical protein
VYRYNAGCSTSVYAGTLDGHVRDCAGEHLALVAKRVSRRGDYWGTTGRAVLMATRTPPPNFPNLFSCLLSSPLLSSHLISSPRGVRELQYE